MDKGKVMTTDEWASIHVRDLTGTSGFKWMRHNHPHEPMVWVICPCGARHLMMDQYRYNEAEPYDEKVLG